MSSSWMESRVIPVADPTLRGLASGDGAAESGCVELLRDWAPVSDDLVGAVPTGMRGLGVGAELGT